MMKRIFVLFSTLLLAVTANAAPVRIAGMIVNGSRNNAPAAGATIKLVRMDEQHAGGDILATGKSDAGGAFDLGSINIPANDLLFARVEWQGYPYMAPAFDGAKQLQGFNVQPSRLEIPVFDTTAEPPTLGFTVHHVAIKREQQNLKCIERIVVENTSNKTFTGGDKEAVTVLLPLPKGARDVKIDPSIVDAKLKKFGEVYGVSKPIMPEAAGQRNAIIVNYTLPFKKEGIDLSRRLQYNTRFFFIAREETDRDLLIEAPQLGKDETTEIPIDGGMQARIVNSVGSPQNPEPALKLGTDVKMIVRRPTNPLVWAFVIFVGALCALVPLTLFLRRKPGGATANITTHKIAEPTVQGSVNGRIHTAEAVSPTSLEMPKAAREWIEKLAQLDEDWEAGKIERDEYHERRAVWKDKVIELLSASERSSN